ncbi:MAG: DMT family transporter, partial [Candidatus Obscuribacterales bacterium]|nr:DMT family transporter [Candidatus Obscuribacterales bacterium]
FFEALGSFAYFVATASYLVAMSKGEASLILGATSTYPVLAQVLAYFFLKEDLVPARIIGCLVVLVGILVIGKSANGTKPGSDAQHPPVKHSRADLIITLVGIVLAVFGWAMRGIFDKFACSEAHALEVNLGKCVCDSFFAALTLIYVYFKRAEIPFANRGLWTWASGSALCLAGGGAAYFIALDLASASYIIAITGCYPVIMYVLAMLILKEKFNAPRALGIFLITLGGIITQTTQGH